MLLCINVSDAILSLVLAKMQFHLNIVQVDCYPALRSLLEQFKYKVLIKVLSNSINIKYALIEMVMTFLCSFYCNFFFFCKIVFVIWSSILHGITSQ